MSNSNNQRRKNLEILADDTHVARARYEQAVERNTKYALDYLREIIADPASGIIAVKWAQFWSHDNYSDGPSIRDVFFYFNPQMFPANEEHENPHFNGWVADRIVKEYVESGMDVINLHELVKVEQAVEDVFVAIDVLKQMELGLTRLLGRRIVVIVRKDRVDVER